MPTIKFIVNPKVTVINIDDVAAIVENAPLTPYIRVPYSFDFAFLTASKACGKGIPIKNVRGKSKREDIISLLTKLNFANKTKILSRKSNFNKRTAGIQNRQIIRTFLGKFLLR